MNTVESFVLSYLLNSLWQVPLLFAAGWLAARVLRAAGAAAEHRVWVGVLLLQGLLPAFSELPLNRLGTLLSWFAPTDPDAAPRVTVDLGPGFGMGGLHLPAVLFATLALLYGSVCVYFVARFLWRCFQLHRMQREADPVTLTGHAQLSLNQCLQRFGLSAVTLAASARVFSPVTLGVTRQLVLLPASMFDGLSEADFHTVLAHELAHIRRNDFLKNLLYEVLSLPATYHPLFWLVRHHMSETREMICDQMAADLVGRHAYAHSLLRLASLLIQGPSIKIPHTLGIFDAHTLERRIMQLSLNPVELRGARRGAALFACIALGAATCASALALRINVNAVPAASLDAADADKNPQTIPAGEMVSYLLTKIPPKYPEEAKKKRIQGKVVLQAIIGKDGNVENLTVLSGPDALQQSSLDAVQQWKYKPYLLNGDPVEVKTTISVIYTLKK